MEKMRTLPERVIITCQNQSENPPYWSHCTPRGLLLAGWGGENKGMMQDRSLLPPLMVLPEPHAASHFSTRLQMHSFTHTTMLNLLQPKQFPHHNEVTSKQSAPAEVNGRFSSWSSFTRSWSASGQSSLADQEEKAERLTSTDYIHSPNNSKLILQFNSKLPCCRRRKGSCGSDTGELHLLNSFSIK